MAMQDLGVILDVSTLSTTIIKTKTERIYLMGGMVFISFKTCGIYVKEQ